jgi:hypothetical protein
MRRIERRGEGIGRMFMGKCEGGDATKRHFCCIRFGAKKRRKMNDQTTVSMAAIKAAVDGDLANSLVASIPGGIEAQEARGQQSFVNSETLPLKFNFGTREELEQMGVRFGEDIDDLFCRVELPPGWKKVATDHSMWSKLVDEKGRERASIFYKAAFYDRKAHISTKHRYEISVYEPCDETGNVVEWRTETHYRTAVQDAGRTIHVVAIRPAEDGYDAQEAHYKAAEAWLNEHYPDWRSKTAYWTDEGEND